MKKKTQILLSSVAAIAMSASLCAGATYALFTSESAVNVSVSSGKVKMTATVEEGSIRTSSTVNGTTWTDDNAADGYQFENNGVATVTSDGNVVLEGMTPGDKVEFQIQLDDESTVTAKYRTVVIPTADTGLLSGLKITIDDNTFMGAAVSAWANTEDKTVNVAIELPEDAGNEYQGKTVSLTYLVEAIQGNASVNDGDVQDTDGYYLISSVTDLWRMSAQIANGDKVAAERNYRLAADLDLKGAPFMAIGTAVNPYCGDFDGNGKTISNFTVTGNEGVGLFGNADNAGNLTSIIDLTVKNATISGSRWVGGIVGKLSGSITGCAVENVTVTSTPMYYDWWMNGDKAGGIVGWSSRGYVSNNTAKNVTVSAYRDVGGIIGAAIVDNWVEVSNNTVDGATVSFVEGYVTYDEDYEIEKQGNIDAVVGRASAGAVVKENTVISATTPTAKYAGSADALADALSTSAEVIILGADVTAPNLKVKNDADVTIDMNGNTLTATAQNETRTNYAIDNYGTITLTGEGSIIARGVQNFGTMTIEEGITVQAIDANAGAAIWNEGALIINGGKFVAPTAGSTLGGEGGYYGASCLINLGKVVINNGTFEITAENCTYAIINRGDDLTIQNATVTAPHGAVATESGNTTTIYDGTYTVTGLDNTTGYVLSGSGTTTVYGGTYTYNNVNNGSAVIANGANVAVYGGTWSMDPSANVAEGYIANANGDSTYTVIPKPITDETGKVSGDIQLVSGEYDLTGATFADGTKIVGAADGSSVISNTTQFGAAKNITVENVTFQNDDGTPFKFNGASGTFKNCTFSGETGTHYSYVGNADETIVFENCTFEASWCYAFHVDGGNGGHIVFKNCTFNNWVSYGTAVGSVTFENCTFTATGYGIIRGYTTTTFTNCTFGKGTVFEAAKNNFTVTVTNCTLDGETVTADTQTTYIYGYAESETCNFLSTYDGAEATYIVDGETTVRS